MSNELPIPPTCYDEPEAHEALRLWVAGDGKGAFTLRVSTLANPFSWGMALADVVRYYGTCAARQQLSVEREDGTTVELTEEQIVARLIEGFEAEMAKPTDTPQDWKSDA